MLEPQLLVASNCTVIESSARATRDANSGVQVHSVRPSMGLMQHFATFGVPEKAGHSDSGKNEETQIQVFFRIRKPNDGSTSRRSV